MYYYSMSSREIKQECKRLGVKVKSWKYYDTTPLKEKYADFKVVDQDYVEYLAKYQQVEAELKEKKWDKEKFEYSLTYKEMILQILGLGDTLASRESRLISMILDHPDINVFRDGYNGMPILPCREMKAPEILKLHKRITGESTAGISQWIYNHIILYIYDHLLQNAIPCRLNNRPCTL
jgi:hypothetical protein